MSDDFTVVGRVVIESDDAALQRLKEETTRAGSEVSALGSASAGTESELAGLAGASTVAGDEAEVAADKHGLLSDAEEDTEGKTSSLAGSMGGLVGAIGGSVVALKAAEWFKSAGEEAMTADQNIAMLSNAMEKNAGASKGTVDATESWIMAQADATGISHDQLIPAYTKLIDTTHSVTESQHILTTAMNISAETHKPLEAVVLALGKAYDGSTAGLSRYGIETKTASGKTMDFKQVMESANKVYGGDAAKAADTTAGRVAKLGENYSQLKEHIGNELMPAEMKLASVGMDLISGFEKLPGPLQDVIVIGGGLVAVLGGAAVALGSVAGMLGPLSGMFALTTVAEDGATVSTTALGVAIDFATGPIGLAIVAIAALVAGVVLAYEHFKTFRDIVQDVWGAVKTIVTDAAKAVETVIKDYVAIYIAVWKDAWDAVSTAVKVVWDTIKTVVTTAVKFIESLITTEVALYQSIFSTGWNLIKGVFTTAWNLISGAVTTGISNVTNLVSALPGQIVSALGNLGSLLYSAGSNLISGLINGIEGEIGKLTSLMASVADKIKDFIHFSEGPLYPVGQQLMAGLVHGVESQRDTLRATMAAIAADVGAGVNAAALGTPALAGAGAGGAGGALGGTVNNYSLTIYSQATTEQVSQSFETMRAMNTRSS